MAAQETPPLVLTMQDARQLEALLQSPLGLAAEMTPLLEGELLRATLVEPGDLPRDVVTMHSRVLCEDEQTGASQEIELVYPHEADADLGKVSVLAPMGAALLGLAVGSSITWPVPGGRMARFRVKAVPFQPQADAGR